MFVDALLPAAKARLVTIAESAPLMEAASSGREQTFSSSALLRVLLQGL